MLIFIALEALLFFLYMFQLNGYKPKRYLKFLIKYFFYDIDNLFLFILFFLDPYSSSILFFTKRFLKNYFKKPFVFTKKSLRFFFLSALLFSFIYFYLQEYVFLFLPLIITSSWFLLRPLDLYIESFYYKEAYKKIRTYEKLLKIGITGSYGKTSIKHILYHLLKNHFKVLMTPGSINTLMGVVRVIRENLDDQDIFICEMGAKYTGNIKELCDLVEPDFGIISYIGVQHLDIFGSQENILKTKLELAQGSKKRIFNLDSPFLKDYQEKFQAKMYSLENSCDLFLKNYTFHEGKTYFTVIENKQEIDLETSLLGINHLSNILPALMVARELKLTWEQISLQVKTLPMIQHRLELKEMNGLKILDNAFNSNPIGAEDALNVLNSFHSGRKIVITPGFIELGEAQKEAHENFGKQLSEVADFIILVGNYQTREIYHSLVEKNYPLDQIYQVDSLQEGQKILRKITQVGDILLFENDLTDDYHI